jgi:hypothetical protein
VFILFHIALYSFTWYRGTTIIILSLRVIKGIRGNAESIAFRIRLIGSILNGVVGICHAVTILGTIAAPTVEMKIRFYYAYYAVSLVYQVCWLISVIKYYTAFINTMAEHLQRAGELSSGSNQRAADSGDLELALAKLRRLRVTFMGSVSVQTLLSICCIVLPPLGSYYVPVWQTTGSFAVLSFLRELKQQEDERRRREGRVNTSSATSTAGTTRSATASSSANTASTVSGSMEPLIDE